MSTSAASNLIGFEATVFSGRFSLPFFVLDNLHSYWNETGTFILTDVRVRPLEMVKGVAPPEGDLTVTVMGGTVGETTVLILGSPELEPGKPYVLFLNSEDLPGAKGVLTVRDHCQGVFDLITRGEELFAVSQANTFALLPDADGLYKAPGDLEGFGLDAMFQTIRQIDERRSGALRR